MRPPLSEDVMANPIEIQKSLKSMEVTFISQEKLGVLFDIIQRWQSTKKERASHVRHIANTLRFLGVLTTSSELSVYAVAVGSDFSGNYGVFVLQERIIKDG